MNNIALGSYLPLNSIIHRLDPRAKICAMLLMMICYFFTGRYLGYVVLGICIICVSMLAKLKLSFLWRAMKPMLFMLTFLLIINLLVVREGSILFTIGSFAIYSGAVSQTLYIRCTFGIDDHDTTILTATTKPFGTDVSD